VRLKCCGAMMGDLDKKTPVNTFAACHSTGAF